MGRALGLAVADEAIGWEAVDEAMVRAYVHWDHVRALADPAGWVFRVGLNWATSWRRKVGLRPTRPIEQLDQASLDAPVETDLYRAVAGLPTDQRAVVVLRYFLDRSVRDVAETLGIREGTVKSRLSRALESLGRAKEVRR